VLFLQIAIFLAVLQANTIFGLLPADLMKEDLLSDWGHVFCNEFSEDKNSHHFQRLCP
jgi:hypothetical protein